MAGKKEVGRDATLVNAEHVRSKAGRFGFGPDGSILEEAQEVPYYMVGKKRKVRKTGRKWKLNPRRNLMRARMSMRSGTTGEGCVLGHCATITYPLSEMESKLLNSMSALNLEEVVTEPENAAGTTALENVA